MCGRFSQFGEAKEIGALLAQLGELAEPMPTLAPRYNIAPTQPAWVVRRREGPQAPRGAEPEAEPQGPMALQMAQMAFGIHPPFMRQVVVNARSETVAQKPLFAGLLRRQRCLVLATGFFEWARGADGARLPWFFNRRDSAPYVFAALHRPLDAATRTQAMRGAQSGFVILTTAANACVAPHHPRMPVLLEPDAARAWLHQDTPVPALADLCAPFAADAMAARAVSRRVSSPRADDAACIAPCAA